MPKTSAAASEVLPFALSGHPLPAPDYLTDEQRRFWHDLVNPFPPEKFGPDVFNRCWSNSSDTWRFRPS
jgi:hypothetical protein